MNNGKRKFLPQKKLQLHKAAHLSIELASFLNEVEKEQLSLENLASIVPDELSEHWQITLKFLEILIEQWPNILAEKQQISLSSHRNLRAKILTKYWQKNNPKNPIIAAGSTGSVPATLEIIKTISNLPNGMVILPGLDESIDDDSWNIIEETHPQYGLKQLLKNLEIERKSVASWSKGTGDKKVNREPFISNIMHPVQTNPEWDQLEKAAYQSLENIQLIEAKTLQEEAMIIALIMKKELDSPGKTTALITNEHGLAKRVSSIMKRWDIEIDDSLGQELSETPQAIFLLLLAKTAEEKASPISLLECLKNPFASDAKTRHNIRELELLSLRGIRPSGGLKGIKKILQKRGKNKLIKWLEDIESSIKPLINAMASKEISFNNLLKTHLIAAESLASSESKTGEEKLWSNEQGEQLKEFFDNLILSSKDFTNIDPKEYSGIIEALLIGQKYRKKYGSHPRLSILSPIEARMLNFDLVILGELNEGSWPADIKADPWMSRPMRKKFGLPLAERKIGQSAHDFSQYLNAPNVIITRCNKMQGTQTKPSRWLLRMNIILQKFSLESQIKPKHPWQEWANMINTPEKIQACTQPEPKPPTSSRPKRLAVTSIEKLMRNPYSIYAAKILKIKALNELDQDPAAAEFGNFIHDTIDMFIKNYDQIKERDRYNYLLEYGNKILKEQEISKAAIALWWPRFERIAKWFEEKEKDKRNNSNLQILSEVRGEYKIGDFTLEARRR